MIAAFGLNAFTHCPLINVNVLKEQMEELHKQTPHGPHAAFGFET